MFRLGENPHIARLAEEALTEASASPGDFIEIYSPDVDKYDSWGYDPRNARTPKSVPHIFTAYIEDENLPLVKAKELFRVVEYFNIEDVAVWGSPVQKYLTFLNNINVQLGNNGIYDYGLNRRCYLFV